MLNLPKRKIKLLHFALITSCINLVLYQYAFFEFVISKTDLKSFSGLLLVFSLIITSVILNAFVFYLGMYLLRKVGKWILIFFFNASALSLYFINTFGVMLDRTMMGNVFNTNYEESSSFFSFMLIVYLVFLGIIPSVFIYRYQIKYVKFKRFMATIGITLLLLLAIVWGNASNWLWIDKNSKTLGALVMPWSYVVNSFRYFHHENKKNEKAILLPNATVKNDSKSIVVLVIGESARSANFSLYGYKKETNPLLSKVEDLKIYKAESAATYTTAGVKAMLDHKETGKLYEILPNYLYRNGIEVIWRTSNWGEPPVKIKHFYDKHVLSKTCEGEPCSYDGVLLNGLKEQILESNQNKILIVLHTSTSHGPTYFKKYPKTFEKFTPVCTNVVLDKCTQQELINAYDNSIVYTDFLLNSLIDDLKSIKDYSTSMLFVSDHGESLGENNLYMHGLPMSIAPEVQFEIPFLVWTSDKNISFKDKNIASQYHVFHTILDLLEIDSPVYKEDMSLVKK